MNRFKIIIKLDQNIKNIKCSWLKILYKKYINPLKDVKQEKKPLKKIFSFEILNLFAITIPKNNDPINETMKLLFIIILKKYLHNKLKK